MKKVLLLFVLLFVLRAQSRCRKDGHCEDGKYCFKSKCVKYRSVDQTCKKQGLRCEKELRCIKRKCVVPECTKNADCEGNYKCDRKTFTCIQCYNDKGCQIDGDTKVCVENACVECRNRNQCVDKGEDNTCFKNECGPCTLERSDVGEHCTEVEFNYGLCRCSKCSTGFLAGLNGRKCHECSLDSLGDENCVAVELRDIGGLTNKCVCSDCVEGADLVKGVCLTCHKNQFRNCAKVESSKDDAGGEVCECVKCRRGYVEDENGECTVCDVDGKYFKSDGKCLKCTYFNLFPGFQSKKCTRRKNSVSMKDGTCSCNKCRGSWEGSKCEKCTAPRDKCSLCRDPWNRAYVAVDDVCVQRTYNAPRGCECVAQTLEDGTQYDAVCQSHNGNKERPWCWVSKETCKATAISFKVYVDGHKRVRCV